MQAVPALNLHNNPSRVVSGSLGYNLRYWQWKSNIDTVHAAGMVLLLGLMALVMFNDIIKVITT